MLPRSERRAAMHLPVRAWGIDEGGKAFLENGIVRDISRSGARLEGLDGHGRLGMTIGIQHGKRERAFRIIWVGQPKTAVSGQVGLHSSFADLHFWGVNLPVSPVSSSAPKPDVPLPEPMAPLSSAWNGQEARRADRRRISESVLVSHEGARFPLSGKLVDISPLGCYVETDSPFDLQTNVRMVISALGSEFRARGIVRLTHTSMGMGIEFTELNPADRELLEQLVQSTNGE